MYANFLANFFRLLTFGLNILSCYFPQWVAPACLFLAAKVEEQPRRLEHVIREAHMLLAPTQPLDARGAQSRVCLFYLL